MAVKPWIYLCPSKMDQNLPSVGCPGLPENGQTSFRSQTFYGHSMDVHIYIYVRMSTYILRYILITSALLHNCCSVCYKLEPTKIRPTDEKIIQQNKKK